MERKAKGEVAISPAPADLEFMSLAAEHSSDVIVLTDPAGVFVWVNPAFARLTGFSLDEVLGRKPGAVLQGPETDRKTVARISRALRDRAPVREEILNYTKAGEPYWIEMNITPIFDEGGAHTYFLSVERDITARKTLEAETARTREAERVRREERRLLSEINEWLYACKSIDELLKVVSEGMRALIPEAQGCLYLYSNSRDVLDGACAWGDCAMERSIEPDQCWALRRGRIYAFGTKRLSFACEHVDAGIDSAYLCLPIVAHGDTLGLLHLHFPELDREAARGEAGREAVESRRDIASICAEQISLAIANLRLREQLQDQSVRDQLTELLNRRWFLEASRRELAHANSRKTPLALLSIDVDRFKTFNDNHGHDAGDTVLRRMSHAMAEVCAAETGTAASPTPCRLGGEEFVVLAPGLDGDAALALGETLRLAVADMEIRHAGAVLPRITLSVGIACFPEAGTTVEGLLKAADRALYDAKQGGRDRVVRAGLASEPREA